MKIVVYIDGFNLYYGAVKKTSYKWLDIGKMCRLLFPSHEIRKIKYFTAMVRTREGDMDLDKPVRQQIYLRALSTLPNFEIVKGFFTTQKVRMKLVNGRGTVEVFKTEEKGTDVSLASHLINDGHNGEYELAVVISNDSDLVELKNKEKISQCINKAYEETVRIFPKWPRKMIWGILKNRQYLRAIQYKAELLEEEGKRDMAVDLYKLLLQLDPGDNQGVRYVLAGIYAKISGAEINKMFDEGNKKQNWDKLEELVMRENKKHKFWKAPEEIT